MDIYNFLGVIYLSKGSTGMGAGFDRHDTKEGGCCRVGGGVGGGSSGRAEFAAACLGLEDSLTHDQPIAVLPDSKGLMTVASNGKDPLLRHSPDGDILAGIIKVLHQRVSMGLFTMIIKIRAHRGEILNEKAVTKFHVRQGIVLTDVEITSFYSLRPDGVAFDDKNKHCVLLEFTRPMDSKSS